MFRGIFHHVPTDPAALKAYADDERQREMKRLWKKQPELRDDLLAEAVEKGWREFFRNHVGKTHVSDFSKTQDAIFTKRDMASLVSYLPYAYWQQLLKKAIREDWPEAQNHIFHDQGFYYRSNELYLTMVAAEARPAVLARAAEIVTPEKMFAVVMKNYPKLAQAAAEAAPPATQTPNTLAEAAAALLGHKNQAQYLPLVRSFMAAGMNINHEGGMALTAALRAGEIELAQEMMAQGFEAHICAEKVYQTLVAEGAPRAAVELIKACLPKTGGRRAETDEDGFSLVDAQSVALVQELPAGGRLTMIFNFALAQQILIAQSGEQIAAPAAVPFSQIESGQLLKKAQDAFIRLGGDENLLQGAALPAAPGLRLTPAKAGP